MNDDLDKMNNLELKIPVLPRSNPDDSRMDSLLKKYWRNRSGEEGKEVLQQPSKSQPFQQAEG